MAPDPEHEARAAKAVARALREVPFYARRSANAATPPPANASLAEALRGIPLLFKRDLRATLPRQWVPTGCDAKAELASGELDLVETAGTTGERARVLRRRGFWARQEDRARRTSGLVASALDGAVGPWREAVLGTPLTGMRTCHAGDLSYDARVDGPRLFLNQRPDPTFWREEDAARMLDEIDRHGSVGLSADPAYLARLARLAARADREVAPRAFVELAHAAPAAPHLRAIARAVRVPTVRAYGATEVGVLFVEGDDGRLHHAPMTTHVELLPAKVETPGAAAVALVVVTAVDAGAQPLVRYVLGDLVQVDAGAPGRFTSVPPLATVEGRVEDALALPGGALVTAGALDRALAPVLSIVDYQANQREPGKLGVDVVLEDGAPAGVLDEVRARAHDLVAGALAIEVRTVAAVPPEASGRFRTARRHVPLDLRTSFHGCEGAPA